MKKIFAVLLLSFCLTGVYAQGNKKQAAPVYLSEAFFDFLIDHLQGCLWKNPDNSYMIQTNSNTYWSSLDYDALFAVYYTGMSGTIINSQGIIYLPVNFDDKKTSQAFELAQKCAAKYAKVNPVKTNEGFLYKTNHKKSAPLTISENVHVYLSLKNIPADSGGLSACIDFFISTEP